MTFPVNLDATSPGTGDTPLPTQISRIAGWLEDLFGLPNLTNITGAILSLGTLTDGKVATDTIVKASTPFKRLIGTEVGAKDFRWTESAGSLLFQVNTGPEAVPVWTTIYSFAFGANFGALWTHTLTADRTITIPDFAGTVALFSAVGAFKAKFSQSNTADRTYTFPDRDLTVGAPQIFLDELTGLTLSNDGVSPNTVLDIAAGATTSDDATIANRALMTLAAFTKTTGAWVVGSGNGGLDTGSVSANTWYHVFVIERTDTSLVDVLFSLSATAPTLPTNYTKKRRIGSFKTAPASTNILAFTQDGDYFRWAASVLDVNDTNPGTAAQTKTLASVPTGLSVWALLNVLVRDTGQSSSVIYVSDLAATDEAPTTAAAAPLGNVAFSGAAANPILNATQIVIRTNTVAQIRYRLTASGATTNPVIATLGWWDRRGRG